MSLLIAAWLRSDWSIAIGTDASHARIGLGAPCSNRSMSGNMSRICLDMKLKQCGLSLKNSVAIVFLVACGHLSSYTPYTGTETLKPPISKPINIALVIYGKITETNTMV